MRVLLIKMSSMGDVLHTLPALTDAQQALPGVQFDWVVEKSFREIPAWHPAVRKVLPIELRHWRKRIWSSAVWRAWRQFSAQVAQNGSYDLILDAQGLLKSAFVAKNLQKSLKKKGFANAQKLNFSKKGETPLICGMDRQSAREPMAAWFYDQTVHVPIEQHAIVRLRQLFAQILGYEDPSRQPVRYGLLLPSAGSAFPVQSPYWIMLHGTTWKTKLWPEENWRGLIKRAIDTGKQVVLPWGTEEEKVRSLQLAKGFEHVWVPESRLSLSDMAVLLKQAEQVVAVDTGLAHLAAALEVPTVVLYRVTDPAKVGALGSSVKHLSSPEAVHYLKQFESKTQQRRSLQGLSLDDVWRQFEHV